MSLWERIHTLGGLTAELRETDWSTGEQQLHCLRQVLLRRSRTLLLDEATSRFGAHPISVLAVMPQLQHVERYDLMVLVDEGRIVELESPAALLARDSEFEIIPCSGKRLASSLQIAGCAWDLQPT
ncbi:uncharacterized protein AFUA_2G13900 [Aspergillus fumigatus Af293]|uniref:ABC transporter n=1 Tax=Aspergillus fumigatus (strain CBS 144.89 / FGSC A1163 / CEA10) TaxID=451804 RepID=B0XTQ2_ASPFC|nr:hypothetical protein AFUB_029530 [Aspergillus fumigatus A1163]